MQQIMQSYRVYLQHVSSLHSPQFHSSDQANVIHTSSILVKVAETSTCYDLVVLLRKKLILSCPEFFSTTEIHSRHHPDISKGLDNHDSSSSSYTSNLSSLTIPKDSLVLVLTCPKKNLVYYNYHEMVNSKHPTSKNTNSSIEEESRTESMEDMMNSRIHEPIHFIRSLAMNELPAQVLRSMVQQFLGKLQPFHVYNRTQEEGGGGITMAMDIRWFFIPSSITHERQQQQQQQQSEYISPLFPTFIELYDGYCTGESSDEDIDDTDDVQDTNTMEQPPLSIISPFVSSSIPLQLFKERRNMATLDYALLSHQNECITGYLLKQSIKDPFVWRRVYCIVVDDGFWWIFRTKTYSDTKNDSSSSSLSSSYTFSKRRHVSFMGATLLEVNHPSIPHVFEISSSQGQTYTFRSSKRSIHVQWMECLSSRIASCHCDHWMIMADIMIGDECAARFSKVDVSTNYKDSI